MKLLEALQVVRCRKGHPKEEDWELMGAAEVMAEFLELVVKAATDTLKLENENAESRANKSQTQVEKE